MKKLKVCKKCGFKTEETLKECPACGAGMGQGESSKKFENSKIMSAQGALKAKKKRRKTMVVCNRGHDNSDSFINGTARREWGDYPGVFGISCCKCGTSIQIREFERTTTIKWTNATNADMKRAAKRKARQDKKGDKGCSYLRILFWISIVAALFFLVGCGAEDTAVAAEPTATTCEVLAEEPVEWDDGFTYDTTVSLCPIGEDDCIIFRSETSVEVHCEFDTWPQEGE